MIAFILALLFAIVWGASENRYWKEANWYDAPLILGHFKQYHLAMVVFGLIIAGMGCGGNLFVFMFLVLWFPLILDVTWWVIRYYDFCNDQEKAKLSYNEPNAWHLQTDWDNWLGLPLVFGVYWWWWLLSGLLIAIGAVILVLN
ncbi:hypothetical protein E2P30_01440 [Candidatus Bathyarchaeota archaeon]|jgi:hypothetical protein|nr:hypothetical protein E2P30_01440 [Candidatus Bathyarchaeota archaeon]